MALKRRKSTAQKVADALGTYAKVKAAKKVAKGAGKAAKGTAVVQVAKRTPVVRRIPILAGAGLGIAAAVIAARRARSGPTAQPS
jgi:hypothetical protein